jgi:hypothetical protein
MINQNLGAAPALFVKMQLTLQEAADRISQVALPTYTYQLRDGLNVGDGTYIQFSKGSVTVVLLCNDEEHLGVFVPSRREFPYYCLVYTGSSELLDEMRASLAAAGIECEVSEESACSW